MKKQNLEMRLATLDDCEAFADIILERQNWFIKNSNPQWNDITDYYTKEYYQSMIGKLYVFTYNSKVVAGAILVTKDDFWQNDKNSLYLHSFASTPKYKGIGKEAFGLIKKYAKLHDYASIRIDCMGSNKKLISIYLGYGFEPRGQKAYRDGDPAVLLELNLD